MTITFLHTAPAHIATFERLMAELAPGVPARHIVDEQLLAQARAAGITPELAEQVASSVDAARADGAALLVCTCSTIGGCAERAGRAVPVLRIDRPMAERAVSLGRRIVVAAALASTLAPTCELLSEAAAQAGQESELVELLCDEAWPHFERGDLPAYHAAIARRLRAAPPADALVLAQASMAGAAELCADLPTPILSSPRLGVEAALALYRAQEQH